jgi:hypothetical protein
VVVEGELAALVGTADGGYDELSITVGNSA